MNDRERTMTVWRNTSVDCGTHIGWHAFIYNNMLMTVNRGTIAALAIFHSP